MPPLAETGFYTEDQRPDKLSLLRFGPTLPVVVGHLPAGEDTPKQTETVPALIDTGALRSCIDVALARRLALPIVDTQKVSGVGGVSEQPVFLAKIDFPALSSYEYGRFAGVKLTEGRQRHSVLLGRTFLHNLIMIYDGIHGHVTLSGR